MWLFSHLGTFAAVAHRDHPGALCVYARERDHLEALRDRLLPDLEIVECGLPDQPFCAIVPRDEWAYAVCRIAEAIDYTEFADPLDPRQERGPLPD